MSELAKDKPPTRAERDAAKKSMEAKLGKASDLKNPAPDKPDAPSKPAATRGKPAEQKRSPAPGTGPDRGPEFIDYELIDYISKMAAKMQERKATADYACPGTHKADLLCAQADAVLDVLFKMRSIILGNGCPEAVGLLYPVTTKGGPVDHAEAARIKNRVDSMPAPTITDSIDAEAEAQSKDQAHPLSERAELERTLERRAANAPPHDGLPF